jgi:hypothetical protein
LPPAFAALAETWARAPGVPRDAHLATELSSFPYALPSFYSGPSAAAEHLRQYFGRALAHTFKLSGGGTELGHARIATTAATAIRVTGGTLPAEGPTRAMDDGSTKLTQGFSIIGPVLVEDGVSSI